MNTLHTLIAACEFNRPRTLSLLEKIEKEPNPQQLLGWRPGPGRAHIAWQLMHIGVTEELFATERLRPGTQPAFADLVARFRGGSTPDDEIPSSGLILQVLSESRAHLLETLSTFADSDLETIHQINKDRRLSLREIVHILAWHEPHTQGQAHITLNLYKAAQRE